MKVLLDTNILIHREASKVLNEEIGTLFNWLDKLGYGKCIHPLSAQELEKHSDPNVVKTIQAKIKNYNLLKTEAPETKEIVAVREKYDKNDNDNIDTSLLKELFANRVDILITEDRKMHTKASDLGISSSVFTIDDFLEKVTSENPELSDYNVLSVRKEYFGKIDIKDSFFDSFRVDYEGFDNWFNKKADEEAYICQSDKGEMLAFLYVKREGTDENYGDIAPVFSKKKRLKIGTFKVISNGFKLGERFLKIVFDNALNYHVDDIYVTLFRKTEEHERLIGLLEDWGFHEHGVKQTPTGDELVFVKAFHPEPDHEHPKLTYPFVDRNRRYFLVPIYPQYHTDLLPDSILKTESPKDFIENEPHRNAIQKVYISRSIFRDLIPGDIIVFYRTGGLYKAVTTTIGIVDEVKNGIENEEQFIQLCRKRSVFPDDELKAHWDYNKYNKPFIVNFLYLYSFPKRLILKRLIELGIIADVRSAPRGFEQITPEQFNLILRESESDESFIVD
ncbi:MAG: hypothetical protein OEZ47_01270 [Gammaproteobacteria bacterium]|nr:hypothetical protein [Gammaproteobacteria bacterium]